ncbi:MAG: DNA/RNA nuclease SfsA [Acutalibacteraceae bacterium]|nr:DNA/RNA nuclease SfsA [Acutalibacteraceae bacterium]
MKYNNIHKAKFIKRLNRFVCEVELEGEKVLCHVKNTGRCRELLKEGVTVYLQKSDNPDRKYKYSLITVRKGERLVNMDSQAPNKAVHEWLKSEKLFKNITYLKPESTYGKSRFDFYFEYEGKKAYMEVKGVTLENDGIVSFPDAPTERGVKHINELCECVKQGYEAYIMFVVQMKDVLYFTPNAENDPAFAKAIRKAENKGVKVLCYDCEITENEMKLKDEVVIKL